MVLLDKAKRLVGLEPPQMHGFQDRDLHIGVVVDQHPLLAFVGPESPSDVLNQLALERNWKGKKQRVDLRTVKPLAQVLASRNHDEVVFVGCRLNAL